MNHNAFSLVELSIVLVILGLLTGGILAGQSLIRASELRSVVADADRLKASTNNFRDKYFSLPGDMPNATLFWGKNTTACNGASGSAGTPGTCNGDGDGGISASLYVSGTVQRTEITQTSQHLAFAGLIEGSYSPNVDAAVTPAARFFSVKARSGANDYFLLSSGWDGPVCGQNGTNILYGGASTATEAPVGGALVPNEAWNIDTKLDDGVANRGKVNCFGNCSDGYDTACDGGYNLTATAKDSALVFWLN